MKKLCSYVVLHLAFAWPAGACAQSPPTLAARIHSVVGRPEFAHATFGIEFYSLDTGRTVYQFNSDQLLVPGSTTKLLTEGTMLELLGGEYRFHTRVYRTGVIKKNGTLEGDIVTVAGGDPNLSGRIQPDGSLAYETIDHSYGGRDSKGLGDPLLVIKQIAQQIAEKGIRRVRGRVLVDATLFPEGDRELGTNAVISPIVVNDNVVDVVAGPGDKEGAPVKLQISPKTAYVEILNQATTGKAGTSVGLNYTAERSNPNGTRSVTLTGSFPLGKTAEMVPYPVPEPSRFAATVLAEALNARGVKVVTPPRAIAPDFKIIAAHYKPENLIADHLSPPLKEDLKITLKVSQNLHASTAPFLLGALLAHKNKEIDQAGFDLEREFLKKAKLDLSAASQSDGAGGNAYFTPDFMVRYLAFMSRQKDFDDFRRGLPILGRDGTLSKVQVNSPAAGHVEAKTGTYEVYDALNKNILITGKGLSGYMQTTGGERLAFASYVNMVTAPMDDPDAVQRIAGDALGEIAAAAYDLPLTATPAEDSKVGYDVIIRNGRIIDGSGNPWVSGDIAITGDRIAAIGKLHELKAALVIDASGLVVSPGFIDMLGQSELALLVDNRSLSKLSQGITTEITGEGASIAPQNGLTLAQLQPELDHYHLQANWSTLAEYFARLEKVGTPINIGTYVGAAQVRAAVLGDADRAPTSEELEKMKALVAQAMQEGAFGISTALIYPPGHYAKTDELIELAKIAAQYGGIYATHMRSEGRTEVAAVDEALRIGRQAHLPVEIFHLKVIGKPRWGAMSKIVAMIQAARDAGQDVSADMYPYIAGATALASALPPWVGEGGTEKLLERLTDASTRIKIKQEMAYEHPDWENLYLGSGGAAGVLVSGVVNPELKKYDGQTLAKIALSQKKAPLDALFDLVLADKAQTGAIYFIANENDLCYGLKQTWTSIGLDASELSLDGPLFEPHSHPRSFGSMPRFLGNYVRDQHLLPLEQAIRKITSLPAQRVRLRDRGLLKEGYFADVTIFDPTSIHDRATYENPTQLSQGVKYVFVNGQLEYHEGAGLTGAKSGKILRGPAESSTLRSAQK